MTDPDPTDAPNEILTATREAQRARAAATSLATRAKSWPLAKIGLAAGIGSAAIAGAVLFAGRTRRK